MKLSIWPKANAHPKSKEEKRSESFKVSDPYLPEAVEFWTDDELKDIVTTHAWSPFTFSSFRHADNFLSCDLLVYDIDEGLTIEQAKQIAIRKNLACLVLPSPSHTEEAHRFRIILPLVVPITNAEVYEATWNFGAEIFPTCDKQTCDLARFYFGCTDSDGFWNEGAMFEPQAPLLKLEQSSPQSGELMLPVTGDINELVLAIYGEKRSVVPEAVDFFIRNAHTGLQGEWNSSLNRFCFSLALSEVADDVILAVCKQLAPNDLDKKDLYQIRRSIEDAKKK
jgi:hypothetical protein